MNNYILIKIIKNIIIINKTFHITNARVIFHEYYYVTPTTEVYYDFQTAPLILQKYIRTIRIENNNI